MMFDLQWGSQGPWGSHHGKESRPDQCVDSAHYIFIDSIQAFI